MTPKITILGCGLSGMITALSLAKYNITTNIIEARSTSDQKFFQDIRTTALTAFSKDVLNKISVWSEIEKISSILKDIYVVDQKSPEMLHFSSKYLDDEQIMGYLVTNTELKKILFNLVKSNKLINVLDNTLYNITKNTNEELEILLNSKITHKCDLLISCDGYRSLARQKYFSSQTEKLYDQHAITFIVHHEKPHENTAVEHFMSSGPFAILPLKNQNLSSIVWTISNKKKDVIMNLPQDEFTYLVQENFGEFLGNIKIQTKIAAFPLKLYSTKQYYNKKIVLLADTAHIIHPLAGQGLNQGIKDIDNLVSLIVKDGVTVSTMEKYQNERRIDNNHMLEITDIINNIFSNNSKLLHNVRQICFKAIEKIPYLKKSLIKYAIGER